MTKVDVTPDFLRKGVLKGEKGFLSVPTVLNGVEEGGMTEAISHEGFLLPDLLFRGLI